MTEDASISRTAGLVIVIDHQGRTLLFRGGDPARPNDGTWWFTPGGGVEGNESLEEAARRELFEETGLAVTELGPVVLIRETTFDFQGCTYQQVEHFFRVFVDPFDVNVSGWTQVERGSIVEHRWWTAEELRATDERFYPERLAELLHPRQA